MSKEARQQKPNTATHHIIYFWLTRLSHFIEQ